MMLLFLFFPPDRPVTYANLTRCSAMLLSYLRGPTYNRNTNNNDWDSRVGIVRESIKTCFMRSFIQHQAFTPALAWMVDWPRDWRKNTFQPKMVRTLLVWDDSVTVCYQAEWWYSSSQTRGESKKNIQPVGIWNLCFWYIEFFFLLLRILERNIKYAGNMEIEYYPGA